MPMLGQAKKKKTKAPYRITIRADTIASLTKQLPSPVFLPAYLPTCLSTAMSS